MNMDWQQEACLVEVQAGTRAPSGGKANSTKDPNASGVILDYTRGLVVTHASVLLPYMVQNDGQLDWLEREGFLDGAALPSLHVRVTSERCRLQPEVNSPEQGSRGSLNKYFTAQLHVVSGASRSPSRQLVTHQAAIECVWKAKQFAKTLENLMPKHDQWKYHDDPSASSNLGDESDKQLARVKDEEMSAEEKKLATLLPFFVLLQLKKWVPPTTKLFPSNTTAPPSLCPGQPMFAVGTPFGSLSPQVFLNSVSRGIVCNVVGPGNELLLTDARCIPGGEGGPLYVGSDLTRMHLIGLVVAPLCWKANEWIGLTVGCSLNELVTSLSQAVSPQDDFSHIPALVGRLASDSPITRHNRGELAMFDQAPVVLVQCGATWGSGIVLDLQEGFVLTCGHVVKFSTQSYVRVTLDGRSWYPAKVVFTGVKDKVFDVALLQVTGREFKKENISQPQVAEATQGATVYVVGHAVFGVEHRLKPSVTSGVVAKVLSDSHSPAMVQSTCAVHAGASGGALIDQRGHLVGMVTSNARDSVSGASFPHINMSVPMATIWPILQEFIKNKDVDVLHNLQVSEERIQNFWQLKSYGDVMVQSRL